MNVYIIYSSINELVELELAERETFDEEKIACKKNGYFQLIESKNIWEYFDTYDYLFKKFISVDINYKN